ERRPRRDVTVERINVTLGVFRQSQRLSRELLLSRLQLLSTIPARALGAAPPRDNGAGLGLASGIALAGSRSAATRHDEQRGGGEDNDGPRDAERWLEDIRNVPGRPAALDNLLGPEVVGDVPEPVAEHQSEIRGHSSP